MGQETLQEIGHFVFAYKPATKWQTLDTKLAATGLDFQWQRKSNPIDHVLLLLDVEL